MKHALIIGAEKNSGLGIARKFLKEGWSVVITSRDNNEIKKVAKDLEDEFKIKCYGFKYSSIDSHIDAPLLFEKIEKEGIKINSIVCVAADLGRWMDPLTVDAKRFSDVLYTNVMGYFMVAREGVKHMIKYDSAKDATIVFIGSVNYLNALPERCAYVASKGAIASMTKALALDFAKYGVRVNCLAPGAIVTDRYDELTDDEIKRRSEAIPLGQFSTKETIGENVYFLASKASFPMTGAVVISDGGSNSIMPGAF